MAEDQTIGNGGGADEKYMQNFKLEILNVKDYYRHPGEDGKIILKWILENGVCNLLNCLRVISGRRIL
jgi:hypothetical protein